MPRKARIDAPGALHHVMARGIEGLIIFTDNEDFDDLLERLESIAAETHTSCYAWSLLRQATVPSWGSRTAVGSP